MVNFELGHEIQKKKFFRLVMNVEQRENLSFRQESVLRLSDHRATENSGESGHFKVDM